ncbi:MAG: hypothetical protein ACM32O_08435, partial [Clostridia bacterium]
NILFYLPSIKWRILVAISLWRRRTRLPRLRIGQIIQLVVSELAQQGYAVAVREPKGDNTCMK